MSYYIILVYRKSGMNKKFKKFKISNSWYYMWIKYLNLVLFLLQIQSLNFGNVITTTMLLLLFRNITVFEKF